jgi:D-beta-D-heptose 7-phosphate kinase/D-beta-D-heptose 1-phosphate adenosyltransferase
VDDGRDHIASLQRALAGLDTNRVAAWGRHLAQALSGGSRLLVAGNGGSAGEAQHLTAELVGRFRDDRAPFSAIALHADTSAMTALSNDYGYREVFARQVRAHGRAGDVVLFLSTSGRSENVLLAARVAAELGLGTWALTGPAPNPLAELCTEAVSIEAATAATVQECHLVAIHLLCAALDAALEPADGAASLDRPALASCLPNPIAFRGGRPTRQLVVVGDALLDRDLSGRVGRLSPEAPIPVVDSIDIATRPGGAALAALLAAADGHQVTFITALADDDGGALLLRLLTEAGIDIIDLTMAGPTPVKTRIRAAGRSLLMLDEAAGAGAPQRKLPVQGHEALASAAAVLVSDYGRGVCSQPDLRAVLCESARRMPLIWDPHPRGMPPVPGTRLVTPNIAEARQFAHDVTGDGLAADIARARQLCKTWQTGGVAITQGAAGATLIQHADSVPLVVPAERVIALDTCGAGDRFASCAVGRIASGALPSEAVVAAVAVASDFVRAGGVSAMTRGDLESTNSDPIRTVERVRARGGIVVATGGCFDLLHSGHVSLLQSARRLGDHLVVCLNSDGSMRRLKGVGRPLVSVRDRAAVLRALACVDSVCVFEDDTPAKMLGQLRPDIYVKGSDYALTDIPEASLVREWGGQVVTVPYVTGRSTTSLIRRAVHSGGQTD